MTKPSHGRLVVLGGLFASALLAASGASLTPADAAASPLPATTVVSAQDPAVSDPTQEAPAVEPGEKLPIGDSSLGQQPSVELSGEVIVSVSEDFSVHDDGHDHEASEADIEYAYSVKTAAGAIVPITGEIPATVSTGDVFDGSVAVDAAVVDKLAPDVATEVEASAGAEAVAEEAEATQEVIAAAAESGAELPVVEAQVTVAAVDSAATAQAHQLVLVANTPSGTSTVAQSDAQLTGLASTAAAHWQSSSNGLIPSFTVASGVHRTTGGACTEDPFITWDRIAQEMGHTGWSSFRTSLPGTIRHLVVFNSKDCAETGVGVVGSNIHYGGAVRMSIAHGADLSTLAHEIGHNLGLGHSNLQVCSGAACTSHEYWDIYDVMGLGIGGYDTLTSLNTSTASRIGFLPASATQNIALGTGVNTQSWTVALSALERTSGIRHVAVTDPNTGERFHLELRSGAGNPTAPYYANNLNRSFGGTSVNFSPGVRMLRATGNGSAVVASPQSGGPQRTSITVGQTLRSPSGGIAVSAVSGSTSSTMNIRVTLTSATTPAADGSMPVYRFWSDTYQGHFYTVSASEKSHIERTYPAHIWKYENVAYRAFTTQVPGTVPLYRFWSDTMNGHFYTANESEKNQVIAAYDDRVWKYERVAYYVYPASSTVANTTPVYRFWSDTKRHHFYTASLSERNHVIAAYHDSVWKYERPAYAVPKS